jgi:hypothetical protein
LPVFDFGKTSSSQETSTSIVSRRGGGGAFDAGFVTACFAEDALREGGDDVFFSAIISR